MLAATCANMTRFNRVFRQGKTTIIVIGNSVISHINNPQYTVDWLCPRLQVELGKGRNTRMC